MKILLDGRLYGLENTGLGRYVMNLVDGLIRINSKDDFSILLRKKYYNSLELPDNWKKIEADFRHYSFAEQFKLPKIINKENPDLVHFPHFNAPLFYRGKYVVTIHDMLMHKSVGFSATTLSAPAYLIKRVGYKLIFGNAVRKACKVIVPSMSVKQELAGKYSLKTDKISVTYEGFDPKISGDSEVKFAKPYFVFVGNAYPHKNLITLVKAIKLLNTKSDHKVFLAISSARNIFTQKIENTIKNEKMEHYVKLLGFLPDEKLGSLFKSSAGFVFPSLSEGFGLPGLEAMNSGTLLLASDIPVLREIYQNHAVYFDPKNPKSLAKTIEEVLKMGISEREKRIQEAKEFVKIYSWDKMAKETYKIYAESCNSLRSGK